MKKYVIQIATVLLILGIFFISQQKEAEEKKIELKQQEQQKKEIEAKKINEERLKRERAEKMQKDKEKAKNFRICEESLADYEKEFKNAKSPLDDDETVIATIREKAEKLKNSGKCSTKILDKIDILIAKCTSEL